MSRSVNKVTLLGNVGGDPEVRSVGTGGRVATFSLATGKQWTDNAGQKQEKTEWHRCVAWNANNGAKLADIVEKYVKKGSHLYVEGEIEYRQWEDKDGQTRYTTEIKLRELVLLGGKSEGAPVQERPKASKAPPRELEAILEDEDDSLPF